MVSGKDGNQEYQCQSLQILSRILFWFYFKELWGRLTHARMSVKASVFSPGEAQSAELSKLLGLEWPGCEFFNYYYIYIYYYYYLVHVVAWTVCEFSWGAGISSGLAMGGCDACYASCVQCAHFFCCLIGREIGKLKVWVLEILKVLFIFQVYLLNITNSLKTGRKQLLGIFL